MRFNEPESVRLVDILNLYAWEHTERTKLEAELASVRETTYYRHRSLSEERDRLKEELEKWKAARQEEIDELIPIDPNTCESRSRTMNPEDDGA